MIKSGLSTNRINHSYKCKANKVAHVKTNLCHEFEYVNLFRSQSEEYYKPLISKAKYQNCVSKKTKSQAWYPLIGVMMICVLYTVPKVPTLDLLYERIVGLEKEILIMHRCVVNRTKLQQRQTIR